MLAASKAVVMARITKDKHVRMVPVAVFARVEQAAPYGRQLLAAHAASDEFKLTGLLLESGLLPADVIGGILKLSCTAVRYCPAIVTDEPDPFAEDKPATS